jgi:outer membrane immunogenic protein
MKSSIILSGVSALAMIAGLASANAADIQQRQVMPAKAPVYVAPIANWTGPYVGINGGFGFGNSSTFTGGGGFPGSFNTSGGLIGGTLGYNWQIGSMVWGLEGDIDWSDIKGNGACGGVACNTRNDWLGTARGRIGYDAGRFMPYVTGGVAFGNVKTGIAGVGASDTTKAGWTLGGGVEAALWGPVSAKLEYLYVDLGRGDAIPGSGGTRGDFKTNIIRAGLNYRF